MLRARGWIILAIIASPIVIAIGSRSSIDVTAVPSKDQARLPSTPGTSAFRASNDFPLTAEMKRDVGALIRARGYNCPEPKLAFGQGVDAYGNVVQLYCGPSDREGVYEKAVFRVTFTPNNRVLVVPWD